MTASEPGGAVAQAPLPQFEVRIAPPDLAPWRAGNTGVPGFTSYRATEPGPHVLLLALMHGNELAGAIVLDRLLRARLRPLRGRLTFGFANLAAFDSFDATHPTASRFIDEDLNRLWDAALLDGSGRSVELRRAREMRGLVDTADIVLDLHSMLWPSDPLILSGAPAKGLALARAIGGPGLVVADEGHASGRRLIDYRRFSDPDTGPCAVLLEAGLHWDPASVEMTATCVAGLLHHLGMAPGERGSPPDTRCAVVTQAIAATTSGFAFMRSFRGGEVIPRRNTLIAMDGTSEIRTPYDNCLLVMPSLRPSRGQTAVRLARLLPS